MSSRLNSIFWSCIYKQARRAIKSDFADDIKNPQVLARIVGISKSCILEKSNTAGKDRNFEYNSFYRSVFTPACIYGTLNTHKFSSSH